MLWEVVHVYTTWNHKHIHVTTTFMSAPMYGCSQATQESKK